MCCLICHWVSQHFWGLFTKRVACRRSKTHAQSLVGREILAVLQGLNIPKTIDLEVMHLCTSMLDCHISSN